MGRRWTAGGAAAAALGLAACRGVLGDPGGPAVCGGPGIPSVAAEVRDDRGRPAAVGATVWIRNQAGYEASAEGYVDPLRVSVGNGENEGGTFEVRVTKPWHEGVTLRGVVVPEDACGIREPTQVAVTLALQPGAPPVRQVVAAPYGYGFGWGGLTVPLVAFVEADSGVSRAVAWTSGDTAVARVTPEGVLTSACRATAGATWVTAAAVADPTQRDSVAVTVFADQDPARCPPP
jgi:hypothetical protein